MSGLPRWCSGEEPACQCRRRRDVGLIIGLGRSPGAGNGNPLQYSCLGNPMDRGAWQAAVHGVTKGQIQRSNYHSLTYIVAKKPSILQNLCSSSDVSPSPHPVQQALCFPFLIQSFPERSMTFTSIPMQQSSPEPLTPVSTSVSICNFRSTLIEQIGSRFCSTELRAIPIQVSPGIPSKG